MGYQRHVKQSVGFCFSIGRVSINLIQGTEPQPGVHGEDRASDSGATGILQEEPGPDGTSNVWQPIRKYAV
jgi:hypothetical protein